MKLAYIYHKAVLTVNSIKLFLIVVQTRSFPCKSIETKVPNAFPTSGTSKWNLENLRDVTGQTRG